MTSGTVAPHPGVALIAEQVQTVRMLRQRRMAYATLLTDLRKSFDEQNAELIGKLRSDTASVAAAEGSLRAIAVEHFIRTRDKSPTPGVDIKMRSGLDYTLADALAWAKETKLALLPESLDEKAFAKIASVQPLPFVTKTETPTAQISSDLDKVLV
jgi:hypothetical protein